MQPTTAFSQTGAVPVSRFASHLGEQIGVPISSLIKLQRGGHGQGTYAHCQIALAHDPGGEGIYPQVAEQTRTSDSYIVQTKRGGRGISYDWTRKVNVSLTL